MSRKQKEFDYDKLTPRERLRFEVAAELGLDSKIRQYGWGSLSAQESGRIGGILASRARKAISKNTTADTGTQTS